MRALTLASLIALAAVPAAAGGLSMDVLLPKITMPDTAEPAPAPLSTRGAVEK